MDGDGDDDLGVNLEWGGGGVARGRVSFAFREERQRGTVSLVSPSLNRLMKNG
jgi:hypothetical protein